MHTGSGCASLDAPLSCSRDRFRWHTAGHRDCCRDRGACKAVSVCFDGRRRKSGPARRGEEHRRSEPPAAPRCLHDHTPTSSRNSMFLNWAFFRRLSIIETWNRTYDASQERSTASLWSGRHRRRSRYSPRQGLREYTPHWKTHLRKRKRKRKLGFERLFSEHSSFIQKSMSKCLQQPPGPNNKTLYIT